MFEDVTLKDAAILVFVVCAITTIVACTWQLVTCVGRGIKRWFKDLDTGQRAYVLIAPPVAALIIWAAVAAPVIWMVARIEAITTGPVEGTTTTQPAQTQPASPFQHQCYNLDQKRFPGWRFNDRVEVRLPGCEVFTGTLGCWNEKLDSWTIYLEDGKQLVASGYIVNPSRDKDKDVVDGIRQ